MIAAVALAACRDRAQAAGASASSASSAPTSTASSAPDAAPALHTDAAITALALDGFEPAVISIPQGATTPRPIVIATHGMWDPPEGLCDNWRWIVGDRAWVLCLRGSKTGGSTYLYRSASALTREIDAGVHALALRFPGFVDEGPMLYTGFSHGAIVGVSVVASAPARFPYAIFTEGGEDQWTAARAKAYAAGGGKRVLFACGLRGRVGAAQPIAAMLERAGIGARVVLGKLPSTGQFIHWYNGPVADEEKAQLPWLLEGDARFDAR
jgi:hypothetical protein